MGASSFCNFVRCGAWKLSLSGLSVWGQRASLSYSAGSRICCVVCMGGGWFPKLVWPKHNMVNQQVKVGVANNDKRAKCWCGTGKVGVATATPAIRHSPPMYQYDALIGDERAGEEAPSFEGGVHVHTCRCTPHLTCVSLSSNGSLATHQV